MAAKKHKKDTMVELPKSCIKKETEKAFLCKVDLSYKKMYTNAEVWVPKSICIIEQNQIIVPLWVIKKSDAAQFFLSAMCASHKSHLLKAYPAGTFDDE